ncbi:hypothetical protein B0H14DRAFT_3149302 [Mycena olivaceomarginata]|nr:hypothetical protein B0H14DRAFT_3149302 [Mycena olivaceomarginata]
MKFLPFLPLVFTLAAALPSGRQTETTCTTRWSGINELIEDFEGRVRVADPTFLTSFYGASSTLNCGGVTIQTYVDNILAVIATPDSWCSINGLLGVLSIWFDCGELTWFAALSAGMDLAVTTVKLSTSDLEKQAYFGGRVDGGGRDTRVHSFLVYFGPQT